MNVILLTISLYNPTNCRLCHTQHFSNYILRIPFFIYFYYSHISLFLSCISLTISTKSSCFGLWSKFGTYTRLYAVLSSCNCCVSTSKIKNAFMDSVLSLQFCTAQTFWRHSSIFLQSKKYGMNYKRVFFILKIYVLACNARTCKIIIVSYFTIYVFLL